MNMKRLSRLYRRGSAKLLSYLPGTNYIDGIPHGLTFDELDELCRSYVDDSLKSVSYCPLSGWKKSAAFRLVLRTESGNKWSVIYKNAHYARDLIPALKRFPINPGPPEYVIYSEDRVKIRHYLPGIYMHRELTPCMHYRYLMEDLSTHHRPARNGKDILSVAARLPELHSKIMECDHDQNEEWFITYDRETISSLKTYIFEGIERYVNHTNSNRVYGLYDNWERISQLYDEKNDYAGLNTKIHGDSNLANIFIDKTNTRNIKFIDWEWAGIGLPHQDLASLLKRARPAIEDAAIEIYSIIYGVLSLAEHKRIYEICQLERGLLDCAFLANQVTGTTDDTNIDIKGYIEDSALRATRAFYRLDGLSQHS